MDFIKKNLKYIVGIAIIIAVLLLSSSCGKEKTPEIVTPPSMTTKDLQPYFPMETKATVKDISRQITKAKETRVPDYRYYAVSQEQADKQAQEYAKKDKADKVVKESNDVEVTDEKGNKATVTENNYYAIQLERKHKIKAGAAVVDGTAYVSAGYQNRDVEYTVYYAPEKKKVGAGVEVTIAKW